MSLRMPAAERREQLLSVALDVFAGEGYHQTSMNQIAEAAGITKPVLYQHFASKRELYLALIEEAGGRLLHIITAPSITETSGRRRVELGFLAYFQWVYDDHDSFQLLFGGGSRRDAEFSEAAGKFQSLVADAIEPLITADIDTEHRRTLAHAIVGLAEGVSRRLIRLGNDFDPELIARQVSELAWAGLRAAQRPL
ncbi:MAG: TetR/AcrR family transcriptional regulator [Ilumatobacteraceae bacterium]|nr:TetR/AcrR family transcriptional regulator [Ilumatobacteraceae bacterium]